MPSVEALATLVTEGAPRQGYLHIPTNISYKWIRHTLKLSRTTGRPWHSGTCLQLGRPRQKDGELQVNLGYLDYDSKRSQNKPKLQGCLPSLELFWTAHPPLLISTTADCGLTGSQFGQVEGKLQGLL